MMGSTHLVTGAIGAAWTSVGLAAVGVHPAACLLSMPVGAYAALLPDLDHPRSTATWSLPPVTNLVSWTIRGGPYDFGIPLVGWHFQGRVLPWTVAHRYATHREEAAVVFGLVLGGPLYFVPDPIGSSWYAFALQIAVGCLVHMWGDMRTSGGLPARGGRRGRRTVGRTFDVGSPHETWLRDVVYRPTAIASTILAVLGIALLSGVWTP